MANQDVITNVFPAQLNVIWHNHDTARHVTFRPYPDGETELVITTDRTTYCLSGPDGCEVTARVLCDALQWVLGDRDDPPPKPA